MLLPACKGGRSGHVVSRSKMAKITADMLLADQWVASRHDLGRSLDTMVVYAPVFKKYGCNADDYRASRAYYVKDPTRYARIVKKSVQILEKEGKALKAEKDRLDKIRNNRHYLLDLKPEKIFSLSGLSDPETFREALFSGDSLKFYVDTTGASWTFDPLKGVDILFDGPALVIDEPVDSLKKETNPII